MSDKISKDNSTLVKIFQNKHHILELAQKYGVYRIRIFGSVVHQKDTPNSDIDFLVNFHPHSLLDRIRFSRELENLLGHPVDVVQEKSIYPHILDEILEEVIDL